MKLPNSKRKAFFLFFLFSILISRNAYSQNILENPDTVINIYLRSIINQDCNRYDLWSEASKNSISKQAFIESQKGPFIVKKTSIIKIEENAQIADYLRYKIIFEYPNGEVLPNFYTLLKEKGEWRVSTNLYIRKEGDKLYQMKNYSEAIKLYEKAIKVNPFDAISYNQKASCYLLLKNKNEDSTISNNLISDNIKLAIKYDPENSAYYRTMAGFFNSIKNDILAIQYYKKALDFTKEAKEVSGIYSNIGICHLNIGDTLACFNYMKKAIEKDSTNSTAFFEIGFGYYQKHEYQKAIYNFKIAEKYNVDNNRNNLDEEHLLLLYCRYSECSYYLNDCENARTYFYKAVELNPNRKWNKDYIKKIENCK